MKRGILAGVLIFVVLIVGIAYISFGYTENKQLSPTKPGIAPFLKPPQNSFYIAYSTSPSYSGNNIPRMLKLATNVNSGGNCGYDENGNLIGSWQCDELDEMALSNNAHKVSVALDGKKKPYVSYHMKPLVSCGSQWDPNGDLGYVEPVSQGAGNCGPDNDWQCTRVDSDYEQCWVMGDHSSLAFDLDDVPYIAYRAWNGISYNGYYALKVARFVGSGGNCGYDYDNNFVGDWKCLVVDERDYVGTYNSIVIDESGVIHITYWQSDEGDRTGALVYAKTVGSGGNCGYDEDGILVGTWQCSVIDREGNVGLFAGPQSIVIGEDGVVRASSFRSRDGQGNAISSLRYYSYVGSGGNCGYDLSNNFVGDWECEDVQVYERAGEKGTLKIDEEGISHIFYGKNEPPRKARHAFFVGNGLGNCLFNSNWQCEDVSDSEYVDVGGGIYNGRVPVITFSARNPGIEDLDLYFAIKGQGGNCGNNDWSCQIVDSVDTTFCPPNFACGVKEKSMVVTR